jgi:cell division topological specificity factor
MSLLDYFSPPQKSATVAKERLQIIVAHQRRQRSSMMGDFLPALQKELIEVVRKYIEINDEHVNIRVEQAENYEVLEVNIALPDSTVQIKAK